MKHRITRVCICMFLSIGAISPIFGTDLVFQEIASESEPQYLRYYSYKPVFLKSNVYFSFGDGPMDAFLWKGSFTEKTIKAEGVNGQLLGLINEKLFLVAGNPYDLKFSLYTPGSTEKPDFSRTSPVHPSNIYAYQNGIVFGSTSEIGNEEMIYTLVSYNIKTGELKPLPPEINQYESIVALSPDKLLLNLRGSVIVDIETLEVIAQINNIGAPFINSSGNAQVAFLTNTLVIGYSKPDIRAHNFHPKSVHSIDLKYSEQFNFYLQRLNGQKEKITFIYFSPDIQHALVRVENDNNRFVALANTTSFRDYLDSKNLLFRPTTAVSTESRVRVRENPNLEAQTFGYLEKGDELEVTDRSGLKVQIGDMNDWWYKLKRKSDGLTGWAYGYFLNLAEYQGELGPK